MSSHRALSSPTPKVLTVSYDRKVPSQAYVMMTARVPLIRAYPSAAYAAFCDQDAAKVRIIFAHQLVGVADPVQIGILLNKVEPDHELTPTCSIGRPLNTHSSRLKSPGTPKTCLTPHCLRRSTTYAANSICDMFVLL